MLVSRRQSSFKFTSETFYEELNKMRTLTKTVATAAAGFWLAVLVPSAGAEVLKVDKSLPSYKKVSGISGNLNAVGSDTMINLMTLWAEGFKKVYSGVTVQVEGEGVGHRAPGAGRGFLPAGADVARDEAQGD